MRSVILASFFLPMPGCYCSHLADRYTYGDDAGVDSSHPALDAGPIDAANQTDANEDGGGTTDWDAGNLDADAGNDAGCTCGGELPCIDGRCVDAIVRVSAGFSHTCAVRASGGVVCWGRNSDGQLGDGTTNDARTPTVTGLAAADAIDVEAGTGVSCAVHLGGAIECWGKNARGQLGDGMTNDRHSPGAVLGVTDAVNVSLGADHACAVRRAGSVVCWGGNDMGETGTGTLGSRRTPGVVAGVMEAAIVSAGGWHTCASTSENTAFCWGSNEDGQLGDPSIVTGSTTPTELAEPGLRSVSAGRAYTCGLRDTGAVTCWGKNTHGQLGTDSVGTTTGSPGVDIPGLTNVEQITAGPDFACARLADGTAQCWGANDRGQLGDGTTDGRFQPEPVAGLTGVLWIDAGDGHACAVVEDGGVRCWGANQYGQLGNGRSMENRTVPVPVAGLP